jgi:4-amino-4-deoxy-L-arabinose transferase-like glycosyltransferase
MNAPGTTSRHVTPLILLLALASVCFFFGLGDVGLTDRDEGRNAEAGREMFETGDWISPTFNYEPRYAKPALVYWLMNLSYRMFGVSEFAARFPSAIFGMGLILLQYWFAARARGPHVGLSAAFMLVLNIEIVGLARMALTDSVLIFFTTLALYGFWLGLDRQSEPNSRHCFWLFYVGMAFATLAKGPVGFIVPLLTAGVYLALARRVRQFWQEGFPLAGTAVLLLLAVPWYAAMWSLHGSDYTAAAQTHTVGRFMNPMEGHGFTIFFYLPVLLLGFFPWSGLLPFAVYETLKRWRELRKASLQASSPDASRLTPRAGLDLDFFAAIWVLIVVVFFSLSATRLPHYIGPLFPAAGLLAASYWHRCLAEPATRGARASIHTMTVLGFLLALGFAALPSLYARFLSKIAKEFPIATQIDPGGGPYVAAAVLMIGMALVGYFGLSEARRAGAFWAAGATIAAVMLIAIAFTLPRVSYFFIAPPQQLAYTAGLNLDVHDRLIFYGPARPSWVFYARRKAIVIHPGEEEQMRPFLTQPGRTMIVLPSRLKAQLPAEAAAYEVVLERFGFSLLSSEPMVKGLPAAPPPPTEDDLKKDPHARYKS